MGKHRAKQNTTLSPSNKTRLSDATSPPAAQLSRTKLWLFRLIALVGAPLVFVGLLELILRLSGYGYPTSFLLPAKQNGRDVFIPNNQFGWRFFGREMARWPYPFSISQTKATNTIRIFVLGESAARGEPQPEFGFPRFLQTILSLKYPATRFEVVNAAMTAINSHTILPIARDCARADGDIWVIYMGNNEVVGPFGAGTVFGSQTPPLPMIRSTLAVKTTRTGQLLDSVMRRMQKSPFDETVWGGMTLFLDQQVRADDPRMNGVRHHFEQNLADIIRAGQGSGAKIVLSTVAVNLKDNAPFASSHRAGLSDSDKTQWEQAFQAGIVAQKKKNFQEAKSHFEEAVKFDDTFAELRFRLGQCALALGDNSAARLHFQAARDLDTLRFRCDTRLNDLIRQAATNRESSEILFADAESAFAGQSAAGLPGEELFFEHVHFTPVGNYLLARTIAEQVEKALPPEIVAAGSARRDWPSASDCAQRLVLSEWSQIAGLNSIIATMSDPPFTAQLDHDAQMQRLEAALGKLSSASQSAGVAAATTLCEQALLVSPDDAPLHTQLATLKKVSGDLTGAAAAARRVIELMPNDQEGWSLLGSILAQQQQLDGASSAFQRAFQLGPQGIKSMLNLAGAFASLGKNDAALDEYHRVLAMKPRCVPALLQLGQLMEKLGRKADAENYFHQALTNRSQRLPELMEMAGFFQTRGAFDATAEIYKDAIRLNPSDAKLQLSAARTLASLGRFEDAARFSAEAVRLAPEFVEAHLMHGIVLLRRSQTTGAKEQFEEALRLRPDSQDARLNLGVTLTQLGRNTEALVLFDEVLQRNPTNAQALKYSHSLRAKNEKSAASPTPATP